MAGESIPLVVAVSTLGTEETIGHLTQVTNAITKMLEVSGAALGNFTLLGAAITAVGVAGNTNRMATEIMTAQLTAFTHSAEIAKKQMEAIEAIATRGIFSREEMYDAVRIMDESHVALEGNLEVLQEIGVRMGNITNAAHLLERIAGSTTGMPFIGRQLLAAGITPEMLQEHGVMMKGMSVLSRKDELMRALKEITSADSVVNKLETTFSAKWKEFINQVRVTGQNIADQVIGPMTVLLKTIDGIADAIDSVNKATHGWFARIALVWIMAEGLSLTLKAILGTTIIENAWLWAQTAIWAWQQAGANGLLALMEKNLVVMIAESFFAAIAAAALGNWGPLIGWAAGAATVGLAAGAIVHNLNAPHKEVPGGLNSPDQASHAQPVRHDEVENIYKRMRGFAYS